MDALPVTRRGCRILVRLMPMRQVLVRMVMMSYPSGMMMVILDRLGCFDLYRGNNHRRSLDSSRGGNFCRSLDRGGSRCGCV